MKSENAQMILAILCLLIAFKGMIIGSIIVAYAGMMGAIFNYFLTLI